MRARYSVSFIIAAVATLSAATAQPAAARDIFQWLFEGFHPHAARSYADPFTAFARAIGPQPQREPRGPSTAYCVRTCDGFPFRVRANANASAAQMCHAFCPGAETRLYSGSDIDTATASDGSRYAALDTAYAYRRALKPGCTCNGRNVFGLAPIDAASDPTLKPGDVVVTNNGLMAVSGKADKTVNFTPAASYPGFSARYRAELSAMKIAPPRIAASPALVSSIEAQSRENRSAAK